MITLVWTGNKVDAINKSPDCFMSIIDALYYCGDLLPNYPVPAIPCHNFQSTRSAISIWPDTIMYAMRIGQSEFMAEKVSCDLTTGELFDYIGDVDWV